MAFLCLRNASSRNGRLHDRFCLSVSDIGEPAKRAVAKFGPHDYTTFAASRANRPYKMDHKAPRVNAARMRSYLGETVRCPCKIKSINGNRAVVELADGGDIEVSISDDGNIRDKFVEIVGKVETPTTLKMFTALNLGDNIDMAVVNHTIELMHTAVMAEYWGTKP